MVRNQDMKRCGRFYLRPSHSSTNCRNGRENEIAMCFRGFYVLRECRLSGMESAWNCSGDSRLPFQIDIRADGEREWRESGGLIRSEPTQSHYRHALGSLPVASYFLRVRAIDGSMSTVATSTSTSFAVSCQSELSAAVSEYLSVQPRCPRTMSVWIVSLTAPPGSAGSTRKKTPPARPTSSSQALRTASRSTTDSPETRGAMRSLDLPRETGE